MKVINRLPDLIAEYREKVSKDATQAEIARLSGVDPAVFSRYINGHVNGFKFDILFRLCVFFSKELKRGINVEDVFQFDMNEKRTEPA